MFSFTREDTTGLAKWWRNIDKQILFSIIFLFLLGLFFSFSSTSQLVGEKLNKETYFLFIKHFIFAIVAIILLFVISFQSEKKIEKFLLPFFLISFLFLFLVPFFGVEIKGSKRWLNLFFLPQFQPVEIVKPLFILLVAKIIVSDNNVNGYLKYLLSLTILTLIVFLLVSQPDIGQTLLIISSWIVMIFVSGINIFVLVLTGVLSVVILGLVIYFFPIKFGYIPSRILSFLDPSKGDNFQSQKALDAIKQGGLSGRGMGEGILKDKVPEAHTDYIIAVISEEFGVLFVAFIVFLFLFIAYKVFNKIFSEKKEFIKLSLIGLISLLIFQTFIHLGVNVRLLPTTGMTLPFLSYGGSSLIGSSIVAGIVLNFTKTTPKGYDDNK